MSDQFFLRSSGKVMGPFTWTQLQDLRKRGRLHEFHELSNDRISWLPAGSLPELFPAAPQGASAPAVNPASGELQWFYADAFGERRGPVARHQLGELISNGNLSADSLVWMKGMPDWRPAGAAVPDLFQTGPPSRSLTPGRSGGWTATRVGLLLTAIATLAFVGITVLCSVAVFLVLLGATVEWDFQVIRREIRTIEQIATMLYVAVVLLEIVGFSFCAASPRTSGTRGMAMTTLVLAIGHLAAYGTCWLVADIRGGLEVAVGIDAVILFLLLVVSGLLVLTYRFFFLLFLRGTALACQANGLARQVTVLTILYGVLIFLFVAVTVLSVLRLDSEIVMRIAGLLGVLLLVLSLGWLVWYIVVLFLVRAATGRRA